MKTIVAVLILFEVICALGALFLVPYGFYLLDVETRTMKGELLPFNIDSKKPIEIQVGGVHVMMTLDELSHGFNLRSIVNFGFDYPFQISLKDNKFLISVDIENANGTTIAKIVDNEWEVNSNNVIANDRNYNSYAFEVIDSDLIPVVQVIFSPQNKMYLGGFYYVPNNTMLLTDDSLIIGPSPENITYARDHTIFKYPSDAHLGEMVAPSTYQVPRTSTLMFIIGGVFCVSGTILEISRRNGKRRRGKKNRELSKDKSVMNPKTAII